jgi:sugar (pentulose or hexulose) kinase
MLPARRVFEPSAENHCLYQEMFDIYRSVSRKLMDDFAQLDAVTRKHIGKQQIGD